MVSVPNKKTDIFCSGHTFLPDGRLLVTGGRGQGGSGPASAWPT